MSKKASPQPAAGAAAGAPLPDPVVGAVSGGCAVVDEAAAVVRAVKAWRDDPRQGAFPHELRERVDAVVATMDAGA